MKHLEHKLQAAMVQWHRLQHPRKILFSVPNGARVGVKRAMRLIAEGLLSGVPDIMCAEPAGQFHGLFVEVKTKNGRLSPNQEAMHQRLKEKGYQVAIARSVDEFIQTVEDYYAS